MITRSRQVALVLTAVLAAGAACRAHDREPSGHPAPSADTGASAPPARTGGRWEATRAGFVPQLSGTDAGRVVDLDRALARGAEARAVRDRIRDAVLSRGAAQDGPVTGE
ncbi:hypothetical protein SUDANB6_00468 [Streptomyces sp. enrichment culture]